MVRFRIAEHYEWIESFNRKNFMWEINNNNNSSNNADPNKAKKKSAHANRHIHIYNSHVSTCDTCCARHSYRFGWLLTVDRDGKTILNLSNECQWTTKWNEKRMKEGTRDAQPKRFWKLNKVITITISGCDLNFEKETKHAMPIKNLRQNIKITASKRILRSYCRHSRSFMHWFIHLSEFGLWPL